MTKLAEIAPTNEYACNAFVPERKLITAGERPASIWFRGGMVRIDIHDAWYLAHYQNLMLIARRTHTDCGINATGRNLTGATFRTIMRMLRTFIIEQTYWYAKFGLTPPRFRHGKKKTTKLTLTDLQQHSNRGSDLSPQDWNVIDAFCGKKG